MHRDSKWVHEAARGGRVKNNKAYDKGKDGVPPEGFFITRPSGPSIFSYNVIFVSPSVFHKQKERGREGHNRKGDETSINF